MRLKNPEAARFFGPIFAHSDVVSELVSALKRLGEYEVVGIGSKDHRAIYCVTSQTVFCGASGMNNTHWRLRPKDAAIALESGAKQGPIGPEWVTIMCFRSDWPDPDLSHWALRAYDYARAGA